MSQPIIILIEPQLGENIGSSARAMQNFGLSSLRIVNPRDGWPNPIALSVAAHADKIIHEAKIFHSLEEAIADLEYIYATTIRKRNINKDYLLSKDINNKYEFNLKTGIMFGRENSGLTNSEIKYANKILTIDSANFSSLNIAQSIVIICYELFSTSDRNIFTNPQQIANKAELKYFLEHLFYELENKNFFKLEPKKLKMINNITNIFSRIDKLTSNELQTLRGIIKTLSSS